MSHKHFPRKIIMPDYRSGSIINLMSSIQKELGGKNPYRNLVDLKEIEDKKNIVLIIIDGLGYEFIKKHGLKTVFGKNLKRSLTSVFPTTTAAATTALTMGVPVQQHGLPEWFVFLKETGILTTILPFTTRSGNIPLESNVDMKRIFNEKSFFRNIKADSFAISHKDYCRSDYAKVLYDGAKTVGYHNLDDVFIKINQILYKKGIRRKFINVYWGGFDGVCHKYGPKSKVAIKFFHKMAIKFDKFFKAQNNVDTVFIVTSDHGQIETKDKKK